MQWLLKIRTQFNERRDSIENTDEKPWEGHIEVMSRRKVREGGEGRGGGGGGESLCSYIRFISNDKMTIISNVVF